MITASARSLLPLVFALMLSGPAIAQNKTRSAPTKPFHIVESGKGFDQLQQAVDAIGDGRGTIRIASGTHHQCAVQSAGRISYVAAEAGGPIFQETICDGQAALVLRGETARIDGVIFQHYRGSDDTPHSALAWHSGTLSIVNSLFRSSDSALIGTAANDASLTISQSSFSNLGHCSMDGGCTAGLSIGRITKYRMTTTEFSDAPLQSEALQLDWEDNDFGDQGAGSDAAIAAVPLISLPAGGAGRIQRNLFRLHAPRSDAPLLAVAIGQSGQFARSLVLKDNQAAFADGVSGSAIFVADGSSDGVSVGANDLGTGLIAYERR